MRRRHWHRSPALAGVVLLWLVSQAGALQLSDIETAVRRNIRDTATSATLQRYSDIVLDALINEGQRDVVSNTWILSKSTSITLSSGVTYYTLPSDLIAIQRVTRQYANLPEVTLGQEDFDNANGTWETTSSTPTYFFQDKSQTTKIGLAPFPSSSGQAGTLRIIYYTYASDLSSDSDIPFNSEVRFTVYHDLLVWFVTYRVMYIDAMWDKAKVFKEMYDTRLQVLYEDYGAKPEKVPAVQTKENKP